MTTDKRMDMPDLARTAARSGLSRAIDGLVTMVEDCRRAQARYYAIRRGDIIGLTQKQQQDAFTAAVRAEAEIDGWIHLYRAEQAKWKAWVAAHYDDGDRNLQEGKGELPGDGQPCMAKLFE